MGFHTFENGGAEETETVETEAEMLLEDIGGGGAVPIDLVVPIDLGGGGTIIVD